MSRRSRRFARLIPGLVAAGAGCGFMVWRSVALWGAMQPIIVTRPAAEARGPSTMTRGAAVVVGPASLLAVAVAFGVIVLVGRGFGQSTGSKSIDERWASRSLSWVLIGLTPILCLAHVANLSEFVGGVVSWSRWLAVAAGWLLIAFGLGVFPDRMARASMAEQAESSKPRLLLLGAGTTAMAGLAGILIGVTGRWALAMGTMIAGTLLGCGCMLLRGILRTIGRDR